MNKLEEVFDRRGPVNFVLAGRRVSAVEPQLRGLTGNEILAHTFALEQCSPGWVLLVRSTPGRRSLAGWEWKSGRKESWSRGRSGEK